MKLFRAAILFSFLAGILTMSLSAQGNIKGKKPKKDPKVLYGVASYYADKFHGRNTASGEKFDKEKYTAACNVLPLGTWIKVTNLRNGRWVIVKTNDRLHPRMKRIVDLSSAAAKKLGYYRRGLTRVKVEVLGRKKPDSNRVSQR
jgi:rare lipoprotein A